MEKLGVQESLNDEKMEKAASEGCPECGAKVAQEGQILICPRCGTEPFEKDKNA